MTNLEEFDLNDLRVEIMNIQKNDNSDSFQNHS